MQDIRYHTTNPINTKIMITFIIINKMQILYKLLFIKTIWVCKCKRSIYDFDHVVWLYLTMVKLIWKILICMIWKSMAFCFGRPNKINTNRYRYVGNINAWISKRTKIHETEIHLKYAAV